MEVSDKEIEINRMPEVKAKDKKNWTKCPNGSWVIKKSFQVKKITD